MTVLLKHLPELVARRAAAAGPAQLAWLDGLEQVIGELAEAWRLEIGAVLTGGTEGVVLEVTAADGSAAVLKLGMPDAGEFARETRVLERAAGRGYVRLYQFDADARAMLLERLGGKLIDAGLSVESQIERLCESLREAWQAPVAADEYPSGANKAHWHTAFIERYWSRLAAGVDPRIRSQALDYAAERALAHDPRTAVLVHGDGHAWNALAADGAGSGFRFVDPDGLFAEPAYDLGVLMREWNDDLLGADPLKRAELRLEQLVVATGQPREAIWQWGFIERVSTGLLLIGLGEVDEGRVFLELATPLLDR